MHTAIFISALISYVHSARILGLFAHTGRSHQMVFEPVLIKLAERGHHLTVASFFPLKNPPPNYTHISFQGIADVGIETFNISIENRFLYKIPVFGEIVKEIIGLDPFAEMAVNICEKAVSWPQLVEALKREYDVVILESFTSDCMIGLLHVFGIKVPIIAMSSSNLVPWALPRLGLPRNPSYLPIVTAPLSSHMTFKERIQNSFLTAYINMWFWYTIQRREQEIIEKYYKMKVPLYELSLNMSLVMVNTFQTLNGNRDFVPGLIEVGGMHLDHDKKILPQVSLGMKPKIIMCSKAVRHFGLVKLFKT